MAKRFTHEQFLEKLWNSNLYYRNGDFEVIGEYQTKRIKIKVRDKFGECEVHPSCLLNNYRVSISSAINKTQYFINMCIDKFGLDGNDDLSNVEYINKNFKIEVIDRRFGVYFVLPWSYYRGVRSKKRATSILNDSKRCSQEEIFANIKEIHPDIDILPNQKYTTKTTNILVEDRYGVCEMNPQNLLFGHKPSIASAINKSEYFANMSTEIHGNLYNYSFVEYKDTITKVKIVSEYGVFFQSPHQHLIGRGCPVIGKDKISNRRREYPPSWNYSNWQKSAENSKYFDSFKVYFIECWDEETGEKFFKIGRTYLRLNRRLQKSALPYKYKVLHIMELESSQEACKLEQQFKNEHKEYKYLPKKEFGGRHECFSKLLINN